MTQSWPEAQCDAFEQVPAGRCLQRPPWQLCVELQSVSAEQPKWHVAFTHQAPTPQSALKVHVVGTLPPAEPPPAEPPPAEPPPAEPPPAEPPPAALPPSAGAEPPSVAGAAAQKPFVQAWPPPQSIAVAHGRTQYPLMHGSRPHCDAELHVFAPGGTGRHEPARQKLPRAQSALCVQAATQTPATHEAPFEHSRDVEQRGFGAQRLPEQVQRSSQSAFDEHESPGQPKEQSA